MEAERTDQWTGAYSAQDRNQRHGDVAQPNSEPQVGKILHVARTRRRWSLRDVERRTGIPNAHLSQIERGHIRQPDVEIMWTLSKLYDLDFALMALWSRHLDQSGESSPALLIMAVNALRHLSPNQQIDAIRYIEQLASDQHLEPDSAPLDIPNSPHRRLLR